MSVADSTSLALRIKPLAACLVTAFTLTGAVQPRADTVVAHASAFFDTLRADAAARSARTAQKSRSVAVAPEYPATTRHVTNCLDDGSAGSLRAVVNAAVSGDTVDLSALTCSTITLASGVIFVAVDDLTLTGPGTSLTVDGHYGSSLFAHTGAGTLTIQDLRLRQGQKYENGTDNAIGGCIFSSGNVELEGAYVTQCIARFNGTATGHSAKGAGVYAQGNVSLFNSTITFALAVVGDGADASPGDATGAGIYAIGDVSLFNSVVSHNYAEALGPGGYSTCGGTFSFGRFSAKYSTIDSNLSFVDAGTYSDRSLCGGAGAAGDVTIIGSTIASNKAGTVGGIYLAASSGTAVITNSTISGNNASIAFGGVLAARPTQIRNSTIAFNASPGSRGGGGLFAFDSYALELESTIVADNTSGGTYAGDIDTNVGHVVTGANNLVRTVGAEITLPADTLGVDPLLGPLSQNGGVTQTHALLTGSPAIDAGNDVAGTTSDQRGPGYPRVVGAAADIGAFELNTDVIFVSGFE